MCVLLRVVDFLVFVPSNIPVEWMHCQDYDRKTHYSKLAFNIMQGSGNEDEKKLKYPKNVGFTPMHAVRILAEINVKRENPDMDYATLHTTVQAFNTEGLKANAVTFLEWCKSFTENDANLKEQVDETYATPNYTALIWDGDTDTYAAGDEDAFAAPVPSDYGFSGKFSNDADGSLSQLVAFDDQGVWEVAPRVEEVT